MAHHHTQESSLYCTLQVWEPVELVDNRPHSDGEAPQPGVDPCSGAGPTKATMHNLSSEATGWLWRKPFHISAVPERSWNQVRVVVVCGESHNAFLSSSRAAMAGHSALQQTMVSSQVVYSL